LTAGNMMSGGGGQGGGNGSGEHDADSKSADGEFHIGNPLSGEI